MKIPFNRPHLTHKELGYISHAHSLGSLSGDGPYTKLCHAWLEKHFKTPKALLTHSCTAALEMEAILSEVGPGDEVIIPSYTFVTTANAFVLRGATPVFVDVRPDTLNLDERLIENAITQRTKAIVPVHYAGVSCNMDAIMKIAEKHKLLVLEDAAQGVMSTYKGRALGTIGDLGAYSFHETKNVISGEGGALCINTPRFTERAEIIREKGTNRSKFFRGQVDKYTWVDIGSSYLPGEIVAAFLYAQLESAKEITKRRKHLWNLYATGLRDLEEEGKIRLPVVPDDCEHNGHLFYVLTENLKVRTKLIEYLKEKGIMTVFHYIPLHSSPAGKKYAKVSGELPVTTDIADRLLRLPLFYDLTTAEVEYVLDSIHAFYRK